MSRDEDSDTSVPEASEESQDLEPMLPSIPMPSPELCLLNSRSPTCLYNIDHERSYRLRLRDAVNRGKKADSDDALEPEEHEEPPITLADISEIKKDLKTYEELLAYLSVKLANKRNAIDILGMDTGTITEGFDVLTRNASSGIPFLPSETLLKALQMQVRPGAKRRRPTKLEGLFDDPETLRERLRNHITEIVVKSEAERKRRYEKNGLRSPRRQRNFGDIAHLPLVDNEMLSVLSHSAMIKPDDKASFEYYLTGCRESSKKETSRKESTKKEPHKPATGEPSASDAFESSSQRDCSDTSRKERHETKSSKGRSQSTKSAKSAASKHQKMVPCESCGEKIVRREGDDTKGNDCSNCKGPNISAAAMLKNLRAGKLCDGSDAMKPRDLALSLIGAGLYEFLPVEFFNEFLQDERLVNCFDGMEAKDNSEVE